MSGYSGEKRREVTSSVPVAKSGVVAPDMSSDEAQAQLLKEAERRVLAEAFYMKRALAPPTKITEGLKHASNMVGQLRTSLLSPSNYYRLYLTVFGELKYLENHLLDEKSKGEKISRLYEMVQYAGNIVPRLYLLITVGSAYIKSREAPAKDILHDLVEMTKGVQQPVRGLFLRFFLSEMTRDKLPDSGSPYEGDGTVEDAIDFVIQNFTEMNKMWVRMQPPKGSVRSRAAREKERMDLRQVVEKNISILAQLDGCTVSLYTTSVLGRIVEQVVSCQDRIAQQALMESIVYGFADEYHLATLTPLIDTCGQLVDEVDVKGIIVSLFSRLSKYIKANRFHDLQVFSVIFPSLTKLIETRAVLTLQETLELLVSFMELALAAKPQASTEVDAILGFANSRLALAFQDGNKCNDRAQVRHIHRLLTIPLEAFGDVIHVLQLPNYPPILTYLNYATRKLIATEVAKSAIESEVKITKPEDVERLLNFLGPLVRDEPDQPSDDLMDPDDFEHDQNLVASLIHLFSADNAAALFALYVTAKKIFTASDPRQIRIRHTYVPLVFSVLGLTRRMRAEIFSGAVSSEEDNKEYSQLWIKRGRVLFRFIHEAVTALVKSMPYLALKLFLQAAQAASHAGFETIAYEFLAQAFLLYEGEIYEAKNQVPTIQLLIGTLQTIRCFNDETYDTLVSKTAFYASKLLVRQDQCHSLLLSSHLFWVGSGESDYRDGKKVLNCLQRALKTADQVAETKDNVLLFIEILNEYIYHFSQGNSQITVDFLNNLIELVNTHIEPLRGSPSHHHIESYYDETIRYIKSKQHKLEDWRAIKFK